MTVEERQREIERLKRERWRAIEAANDQARAAELAIAPALRDEHLRNASWFSQTANNLEREAKRSMLERKR